MNPEQLKLHFRRFELKYPLSLDQYRLIRPLVARRLSPDPFVGSAGYYQVNSLYFDTPNLNAYHQSRAGLKNRIKYRLRTYSTAIPAPPYAFLEIKRKHDATVLKDRDLLSLAQVDQLLAHQSNSQNSVIKQFTLAQTRYFLQPQPSSLFFQSNCYQPSRSRCFRHRHRFCLQADSPGSFLFSIFCQLFSLSSDYYLHSHHGHRQQFNPGIWLDWCLFRDSFSHRYQRRPRRSFSIL